MVMLVVAGVALLRGSIFGEAGAGYVRLCYATNKTNIAKGIERMNRCLKKRRV